MDEMTSAPAPSTSTPSEGNTAGGNTPPSGMTPPSGGAGSTEQQGVDAGKTSEPTAASTPGKTPPATPEELYEVKSNGKLLKMTRQEVLDRASMSLAAQEKFDEASKMRKEYEANKEKYSKDPVKAFLDYASSLPPEQKRKLLEDYYTKEYIEPETLTEDQRKIKEYESRFKQQEEEQKTQQQKQEQEELEKLTSQYVEQIQTEIIGMMEKSGFPKESPYHMGRIAFYMQKNAQNGWDAPPEMIINQVKNESRQLIASVTENATAEQLNEMMPGVVEKLRQFDLKQLREKRNTNPFKNESRDNSSTDNSSNGKLSMDDVDNRLMALRMGKILT